MTDKPIIFSGPMVRALLDWRKTQTRRVLKPQPHGTLVSVSRDKWMSEEPSEATGGMRQVDPWRPLPYAPGDRLWVREAWRVGSNYDHLPPRDLPDTRIVYAATDGYSSRPRPSIHMPRRFSRLTLTVTDVLVQRLQEISEEDARAEGVEATRVTEAEILAAPSFIPIFRGLWNSLHGPDAWAANPWVCAISFTVEKRNIDEVRP